MRSMRRYRPRTVPASYDALSVEVFRKLAVTCDFRGREAGEDGKPEGEARRLMPLLEKLSPQSDGPQRFSQRPLSIPLRVIVKVLFWRISFRRRQDAEIVVGRARAPKPD
jgi:hypothetical protein